ncbi:hypothetical protein RUM44_007535 [Polyplax serrata]|uniref:Uncharacterized protein n=1 Tax=Polyplax serrata TaxID=468196 RepID=A0ABR1B9V1_POLSC
MAVRQFVLYQLNCRRSYPAWYDAADRIAWASPLAVAIQEPPENSRNMDGYITLSPAHPNPDVLILVRRGEAACAVQLEEPQSWCVVVSVRFGEEVLQLVSAYFAPGCDMPLCLAYLRPDGSNASEGEPCDLMSLCEGDQRLESTAEMTKQQFRDRVEKLRAIMKFGMNVEDRMCEVFGIVTKEMMQDFMDDIWKAQESANEDKTVEIRSDLNEIKTAMQVMTDKVQKLEARRGKA